VLFEVLLLLIFCSNFVFRYTSVPVSFLYPFMKINVPEDRLPRVVIIGGGFGGIMLAKNLSGRDFQVVLLDKHNYHTFQPLLYQVATAGLEPDSIAFPIRKLFDKHENFYFRMAQVTNIVAEKNQIETNIGVVNYDYLVIATGSQTNYFGLESFSQHSMPMKSIPEALNLRSLILQNFEKALLTSDLDERQALMNIVIVGGGPSGVETAGALGELKKHVLPNDYPDLDIRQMQIILIEASPRLLAAMNESSSKKALEYLDDLDVDVFLNSRVNNYDGNLVVTQNNKSFKSKAVIWTAGVVASSPDGLDAEAVETHSRRIKTDEFNRVTGSKNIFAIGDTAMFVTNEFPKGLPMLAPVAIQQGTHLAKNLKRMKQRKEPVPFKYYDKGTMATIGRNRAVVELGKLKFQGLFAWYMWMFVHLISLVGFKNRLVVLVNWIWNYFSYDRGIRLIIRPYVKK
jgi:NADH dehydrogenase